MSACPPDRFRLTVLGCSTASPHQAGPASGYLLEWGETAILLDVGQGVIRRLQRLIEPTQLSAVIVGHMHADHYLDLAGLRYLFPWGEAVPARLPVHLPPGGRASIEALATAISERPGFFEMSYALAEYDPEASLAVGPLRVRFVRGRHYVPAWGVIVDAPDGTRLAYTGDTGPSDEVLESVRGADLLLVEAALRDRSEDDPDRGHLTAQEAIAMAARAGVRSALLVHYAPSRRAELEAACEAAGPWIRPAVAGLAVTVERPAQVTGPDTTSTTGSDPAYPPRSAATTAAARER